LSAAKIDKISVVIPILGVHSIGMTVPDPKLRLAYLQTTYMVDEPPLSIRIGQTHPRLDEWLAGRDASSWAFLTAWNPQSNLLSDADNKMRMNGLVQDLAAYLIGPGRGLPPDPGWQAEESLLVVGISKDDALRIARKWDQLAFVYGESGGPAILVWC